MYVNQSAKSINFRADFFFLSGIFKKNIIVLKDMRTLSHQMNTICLYFMQDSTYTLVRFHSSPAWELSCTFKEDICLKVFGHRLHMSKFAPVCNCSCLLCSLLSQKRAWQYEQEYSFALVCSFASCNFLLWSYLNFSLQCLHW